MKHNPLSLTRQNLKMLALVPAALLLQADLTSDLSSILADPALGAASVGVVVKEAGGQVLFSQGGDKRLVPASALKVVTAAFALDALGANHRFVTTAWREGKNVYLKGAADPLITIDELADLGARIGAEKGDTVHFDDSLLGPDRINGAWEFGDMMRADAPPVSGLTVNGGYADLVITGGSPRLRPRNFGMAIKRGRTSGEPSVRRDHGSWTVRVDGKLPSDDPEFATVSLPDPALCAAMIVSAKATRAVLNEVPPGALRVDTRTLSDVLPALLKSSDNHAAETLLRLSGQRKGKSGSWDDALEAESAFMERAGVSPSSFRLADGSGLSRFNEITARAIVRSLEWSLTRETAAVFGASMCAPGEGTMRNRLLGVDVRAKTGTLTGACSLVGYIDVKASGEAEDMGKLSPIASGSNRRIIFAIIFNHYDGRAADVRPIQDAIVKRIAAGSF